MRAVLLLSVGCTAAAPYEPPRWVDLVAQPCVLDAAGEVKCWQDPLDPLEAEYTIDGTVQARSLQSETPGILRGVLADGMPAVLACELESCPVPDVPVQLLADWGGLSATGDLVQNPPVTSGPPGTGAFVLADAHSRVVLDSLHVLYARVGLDWLSVQLDFRSAPQTLVGDAGPDGFAACVLDALGSIDCVGHGTAVPLFDAPPYVALAGAHGAFCAVDTQDRISCNDGTRVEWGPVTRIAAARYPYVDPETGVYVGFRDAPISLCALTEGGLECVGPRYPDGSLRVER